MTELWHDECRRLRAEGLSMPEIGAQLGRSSYIIRCVLNETPEQKATIKRVRESAIGLRHRELRKIRTEKALRRPTKSLPGVITPEIKQAAILAFAKHEIDRGELMRRITPREKWRAAFHGE